jgi:hypothetical protein
MDPRDTPFDIYAQHVSAAGAVQWGAGGVAICTAAGGQKIYPRIVSDGAGGAIVTWWDRRNGYNRGDIYAQRISGDGGVLWTADGVAVCVDSTDQQAPAAVSDGAGGAVIAWRDLRTEGFSGDIYAQRISAGGAPQWATDGVAVCTASNDQANTTIASDGAGGAVLAWTDSRGGSSKTYAQRISGTGAAQWTGDGVALCTGVGNEWTPAIAPDSAGGAIVVWRDDRFFDVNGGDVYAQRVSAAGAIQWSAPGVTVCNNIYGNQIYPQIIADGAGGAVVTWEDYRGGDYYAADVYARKLTAAGALQWTFSGAAISTATGGQTIPTIASDGGGGAIIAWQDSRNGYDDIYAQRVLSDGQLGGSAVSVPSDVPPSLALALAGPNPVRGGPLRVRFTLEGGAPASIELLDLAGRRLTARGVDAFGAGPHTLDLAEGRHLAPGIYWLRLRQGASTRLARVAVLE